MNRCTVRRKNTSRSLLRTRPLRFALLVACLGLAGLFAAADASAQQDTPEDRATEFVGVEGAPGDQVPGGPLTVAAYGVIWLLAFGYLFRLGRMQRGIADEIARLKAAGQRVQSEHGRG